MTRKYQASAPKDNNAIITKTILDQLGQGIIPWHKPWHVDGPYSQGVANLITGYLYTGLANIMQLSSGLYESPWWMTYRQASTNGWQVRAGEKGTFICWFSMIAKEDETTGKRRVFPATKGYYMFNSEQVEGAVTPPPKPLPEPQATVALAEQVIECFVNKPKIMFKPGDRCFYAPGKDVVVMVPSGFFSSSGDYYATMFHELIHSTMHASRLNRFTSESMEGKAMEELVAELGSAYLCGYCGLNGHKIMENHTAYIQSCFRQFEDDKRMFMRAASAAKKAVNYILGIQEVEREAA
jgi:antirestriction protein ArdC